jgi:PAS domain S-box-containing protein
MTMGQKILIVEDDLVFRNYLYQVLKYDYDVVAVPGPLEAIEEIKKDSYSLMITDLRMPDMDGRALVEKVHKDLDSNIMVIVITAFEDDWPVDIAMSSDVFRYLRKGAFMPSELKQNVEKALEVQGSIVSLEEYKKKEKDSSDHAGLLSRFEEKSKELDVVQKKFHRLTTYSKDMIIWVDGACTCEFINAEVERCLGYTVEPLMGKEFPWQDIVHPDDRHIIEKVKDLKRARVSNYAGEIRVFAKSGSMLYLTYHIYMEYEENGTPSSTTIVAEDITQQKVAEQELKNANLKIHEFNERLSNGFSQKIKALRESEERYKNIVEESGDIIFSLDGDARIIYMNRTGLQTIGMSMERVYGLHCGTFIADESSKKRLGEIISTIGKENYHEPLDLVIDTPIGSKIYRATLAMIGEKSKREIVCVAKDISDEIAKSKRLQLLANIEHHSADAIIGLDPSGEILSWNEGASMMFGWSEEEAIGKSNLFMVPDDGLKEAEEVLQKVRLKGQVKDYETKLKEKSGQILDVSITLTTLKDESGEIFGFSSIIKDLMEKKKMEAALVQSERLAAMGKLSASIAHEINNPLYGIRSCLNHVLNVDRVNIDHQFVKLAIKETDRIADLIRNMKTFYLPNEGKAREVDIHETLREVFILNRKYLEENMVKMIFNPEGTLSIECVPEQIKQVFINIITNAVEAMPEGGALHVETHEANDGQSVNIVFRDTGVGISKDDLPQIFDMFYSKKPMVKSVGLGLSVSYGIVKRHGGTIDIESEEGRGTTVIVALPVNTDFARQMHLDLQ